ncbi:MAG: retropepsin-like aspartic protease family protein, partial [Methyloligellaceae bacterium]
ARTDINGQSTQMIGDTGATTIVLTQSDARRIGVDLASLTYGVPVQTANGTSFAARVRLSRVSVGSVRVNNVEALIARPGALHKSLLGMSFLSRLRSYEFSGDVLTLRS